MMRFVNIILLAIAVYGMAAWVYVAAVAVARPDTLAWPLTHFAGWPRTDTFGEISFAASFLAFMGFLATRTHHTR